MRQEPLLEIEPYAFDGVELWRIGRQCYQRDILRDDEAARDVPAGLIEHHDGMLVAIDGGREAVQELLHRIRVRVGQNKGEAVIGAGLDSREDVGKREAIVGEAWRTLAASPPDVARAPLLADPSFVLEKEADALAFMRTLNFSDECRGSF